MRGPCRRGIGAEAIIALENVLGTLTSHGWARLRGDLQDLCRRRLLLRRPDINAAPFVSQSRPRLFIVGVRAMSRSIHALLSPGPIEPFHTRGLTESGCAREPTAAKRQWSGGICLSPVRRNTTFARLIEDNPKSVAWHTRRDRAGPLDREDVFRSTGQARGCQARRASNGRRRLQAYPDDERGRKVQRAEVRFDEFRLP